ncbi:hypothetical protein SALBM311S_00523 [Streptomyces alboniger]
MLAPDWLARVDALREILTSDGRTLAQGSLAWLWARSPRTVPIPGFRSVAQAEQNAGALEKGPLTAEQLAEVDRILGDERPHPVRVHESGKPSSIATGAYLAVPREVHPHPVW